MIELVLLKLLLYKNGSASGSESIQRIVLRGSLTGFGKDATPEGGDFPPVGGESLSNGDFSLRLSSCLSPFRFSA